MPDLDNQQLPLFSDDSSVKAENGKYSGASANALATPFSKYIVYVDESGDHSMDKIDPQYPLFVLALCVFHKRHYSEKVVSALEKFKFNHFGHDQVVLHETEIRKEKGAFNIFRGKRIKWLILPLHESETDRHLIGLSG